MSQKQKNLPLTHQKEGIIRGEEKICTDSDRRSLSYTDSRFVSFIKQTIGFDARKDDAGAVQVLRTSNEVQSDYYQR
jgi:hypothetical protein